MTWDARIPKKISSIYYFQVHYPNGGLYLYELELAQDIGQDGVPIGDPVAQAFVDAIKDGWVKIKGNAYWYFRDWHPNVILKRQEAIDFLKGHCPYEKIGVQMNKQVIGKFEKKAEESSTEHFLGQDLKADLVHIQSQLQKGLVLVDSLRHNPGAAVDGLQDYMQNAVDDLGTILEVVSGK